MAVEKYIALASLGLFVMFVGEMITLYTFMIETPKDILLEPNPKILQYISIGVAPACILAGVSFLMSRRYGSRPIGAMIIGGGVILLVGMAYTNTLIDKMNPEYLISSVTMSPPVFMVVSIPVMVVGALLFRVRKRKKPKKYL
ncbi:MAG: hypothetical protein GWN01_03955 [Nitrosopumilaceae archaeon]|nr:hypothetical protein [Nitrosopumilaceae archaeon]NIU00108.1 hypothetical protein [Nitrosopumilaceae archaeon]NIU86498.1 hypothetical protein [Nitrosopumilaceae archaeon]NIV65733.1 hypothetical protein [Nitrosopumilaceae archaeon]NIX60710.1 hypothetical protein [Nitrosopumilaceae archaeon]